MPEATLTASLDPDHPIVVAGRETDGTVRVVGATPRRDPAGSPPDGAPVDALIRTTGEGADAAAETLLASDATARAGRLDAPGDRALVHCRLPLAPVSALAAAGVALEPPLSLSGRALRVSVRTTDDRLSALRESLAESAVDVEVESVSSSIDRPELLSERQERVLSTALEEGYYEVPRDASVGDVADAERLAKSTVAETLRRAERALAEASVEE